MMGQRLVLRSKSTGKIASRKDQGQKALAIEAQRLTNEGFSGGITSLLLPKSAKEKAEINAIMTSLGGGYQLTEIDLSGFSTP